MSRPVVVVQPGQGHRIGNVEFLARTEDTPFFNLAIIVLEPGTLAREFESAVKAPRFMDARR